jgi:hypothetical protein
LTRGSAVAGQSFRIGRPFDADGPGSMASGHLPVVAELEIPEAR